MANYRFKKGTVLDGATYRKYALIASAAGLLLSLVLYLTTVLNSTTWGSAVGVSAGLTALFLWKGENRAVRWLVRVIAWLFAVIGAVGSVVCTVLMAAVADGFDTAAEPLVMAAALAMSLNILLLADLPMLSALAATGKPADIWLLRIAGVFAAVIAALGAIFCTANELAWGIDNVYFKIFTCLVIALVPAFGFLIPTKQKV